MREPHLIFNSTKPLQEPNFILSNSSPHLHFTQPNHTTQTKMPRNICITSIEGQTGFLIAELLLTDPKFKSQLDSLTGLTLDPASPKAKELATLGATVVAHKPGRERDVVAALKKTGCDTICLVPPARRDKFDIAAELTTAAKKAGVQNVLLISAAGCDYAERDKQPRLREFVDLEALVLAEKGDPESPLGHSPCVIR